METESRGLLRRAFGRLWRFIGWLRVALANLVFLLLLVLVVVALTIERGPNVPARAALVVAPTGKVVEQLSFADPLTQLFGRKPGAEPETLLKDIVDAIDRAAKDPRIQVAVLALDGLERAGITKTRDIAAALDAFRKEGKKIIAVGDSYTQEQYLLASHANEVWMHPMGSVELNGIGIYRNYFAEALKKLKIDVHVFRSGTYKSAYEFLERDNMSDADRLASGALLQEIWSAYTADVSGGRKLPPGAVDHYANEIDAISTAHKGNAAAAALEYGFVDALKTRRQMDAALVEMVGEDEDGGFSNIDFNDYLSAVRPALSLSASRGKPSVAVLVASGLILDGEQAPGTIGGDTLAKAIHKAGKDDDIKALVLRIDSPGGSAFASEIIRDALAEFHATGKPLVASMGSVAASGGYWIAMPADEVWASATTITGSIGVLSAFPSITRALDSLGIHNDGIGTTDVAGGLDIMRPLSDKLRTVLSESNQYMYERFVALVAEGRKLDRNRVAELAEGRVWTGAQAVENGLVDHIGDIDDAVAAAARLAKLPSFETRYIEPSRSLPAMLISRISHTQQGLLENAVAPMRRLRVLAEPICIIANLNDPRGQYALCAACVPL